MPVPPTVIEQLNTHGRKLQANTAAAKDPRNYAQTVMRPFVMAVRVVPDLVDELKLRVTGILGGPSETSGALVLAAETADGAKVALKVGCRPWEPEAMNRWAAATAIAPNVLEMGLATGTAIYFSLSEYIENQNLRAVMDNGGIPAKKLGRLVAELVQEFALGHATAIPGNLTQTHGSPDEQQEKLDRLRAAFPELFTRDRMRWINAAQAAEWPAVPGHGDFSAKQLGVSRATRPRVLVDISGRPDVALEDLFAITLMSVLAGMPGPRALRLVAASYQADGHPVIRPEDLAARGVYSTFVTVAEKTESGLVLAGALEEQVLAGMRQADEIAEAAGIHRLS